MKRAERYHRSVLPRADFSNAPSPSMPGSLRRDQRRVRRLRVAWRHSDTAPGACGTNLKLKGAEVDKRGHNLRILVCQYNVHTYIHQGFGA